MHAASIFFIMSPVLVTFFCANGGSKSKMLGKRQVFWTTLNAALGLESVFLRDLTYFWDRVLGERGEEDTGRNQSSIFVENEKNTT